MASLIYLDTHVPLVTKDGDIHEHYRGALWITAPSG